MTLEECYNESGADYADVLKRLGDAALVEHFALKFLSDASFEMLEKALTIGDGETAFRAAHTLKGIASNLGFTELYQADFELTEKLRDRETKGSEALFEKTKKAYEILCDNLRKVQEG